MGAAGSCSARACGGGGTADVADVDAAAVVREKGASAHRQQLAEAAC